MPVITVPMYCDNCPCDRCRERRLPMEHRYAASATVPMPEQKKPAKKKKVRRGR